MHNSFEKDKVDGKVGVHVVMDAMRKFGLEFVGLNSTSSYDMMMKSELNGKLYMYEVKTDFQAQKTGNIVVEFESRGNRSGILVSRADAWAFYLVNQKPKCHSIIWTISTKKLKSIVVDNELDIVGGGDDDTSMMWMVPMRDFYREFRIYDV